MLFISNRPKRHRQTMSNKFSMLRGYSNWINTIIISTFQHHPFFIILILRETDWSKYPWRDATHTFYHVMSLSLTSDKSIEDNVEGYQDVTYTEDEFYGNSISDGFENMHEFDDCYLSKSEYEQLQTPSTQKWKDNNAKNGTAKFTINTSKDQAWKLAKSEICHICNRLKVLLDKDDQEHISNIYILQLIFGKQSNISTMLMKQLSINHSNLLRLLSTLCLQSSYCVTVTQLYSNNSSLKNDCAMEKEEYLNGWKGFYHLKAH